MLSCYNPPAVETDDTTLVTRLRSGERAAFAPLVERYAGRVARLCQGIVRNPAVAEELAQDSFLKAWRGLAGLHDPARFAGWLLGIARNRCLDWLRQQQRGAGDVLPLPDGAPPPDPRRRPASEVLRLESDEQVRRAVDALPAIYREVIELRYYAQAGYREMAQALSLSEAGVNQRLTRARARLRQALERQEAQR